MESKLIPSEIQTQVMSRIGDLGEMLDAISVSADHLKDIVDTVLTASMIEKKGIKLQDIIFKPQDIIDKVRIIISNNNMSDLIFRLG